MVIYEEIFKQHGLSKTQQEIIRLVGENKTVLEIGPSTGYMTKAFLKKGCVVDVVENNKDAVAKLPKGIRKVLNFSIEDTRVIKLLSKDYDFIILADVLEHLVGPSKVLSTLSKVANKDCLLIVSMPNIASWVMRKQLFFKGDFSYQESGILDKTHLHFYSVETLPKLLSENNWEVKEIKGTISRFPFEGFFGKIPVFGYFFKKIIYQVLVEKYPNLSYYHFFVTASKK